MRAGFGLASSDDLRELCVSLWAKSSVEAQIVRAAFARVADVPHWNATEESASAAVVSGEGAPVSGGRRGGPEGDVESGGLGVAAVVSGEGGPASGGRRGGPEGDVESGGSGVAEVSASAAVVSGQGAPASGGRHRGPEGDFESEGPGAAQASPVRGLNEVPLQSGITDRSLVLIPQYPLTSREVAQVWRHLRRPIRSGPAVQA